jgi:hypothetical protein
VLGQRTGSERPPFDRTARNTIQGAPDNHVVPIPEPVTLLAGDKHKGFAAWQWVTNVTLQSLRRHAGLGFIHTHSLTTVMISVSPNV